LTQWLRTTAGGRGSMSFDGVRVLTIILMKKNKKKNCEKKKKKKKKRLGVGGLLCVW